MSCFPGKAVSRYSVQGIITFAIAAVLLLFDLLSNELVDPAIDTRNVNLA
jgi:hypothetical protein